MNPYEELGLTSSATDDEIKQRYRSLAQQHHPDRGGDEEKFKRIKHAYEILSDPKTRKEFDSFGTINNIRTAYGCALNDVCLLARTLIPTINPDKDNLIIMMKSRVTDFRRNIMHDVQLCKGYITNLQKIVDRTKTKTTGNNFIRNIAEDQLRMRNQELAEFQFQIEVNTEMLKILDNFEFVKEEIQASIK